MTTTTDGAAAVHNVDVDSGDGKTQEAGTAAAEGGAALGNGHDPSPASETLPLAEALDFALAYARQRLILPEGGLEAVTIWCAFTYLWDRPEFQKVARIVIPAPEHGSGKSSLLEYLSFLAHNPTPIIMYATEPVIRDELARRRTLFLDEGQRSLKGRGTTIAILNGWGRKDRVALKREKTDPQKGEDRWMTVYLPTRAPAAIAYNTTYGRLPPDLMSRCVEIEMEKARPKLEWNDDEAEEALEIVRNSLDAWANSLPLPDDQRFGDVPYEIPADLDLTGRKRQKWLPLLTVAALAGYDWWDRICNACRKLDGKKQEKSAALIMLEDAYTAMCEDNAISCSSTKLTERLTQMFPERYEADKLKPTSVSRTLGAFKTVIRGERVRLKVRMKRTEEGPRTHFFREDFKHPLRAYGLLQEDGTLASWSEDEGEGDE